MEQKQEEIQRRFREILELLGEDPAREGLQKTPLRGAKAVTDLTACYDQYPITILNSAKGI